MRPTPTRPQRNAMRPVASTQEDWERVASGLEGKQVMEYSILYADVSITGYALPQPEIRCLLRASEFSEFQFLTHEPMEVGLSKEGGLEFPDLMICEGCIPLISQRLRASFLQLGLENVFYKPVNLVMRDLGVNEPFWLALPPRIDCLDWEKCEILEDTDDAFPFWARLHEAKKIVIAPDKTGNYKIFKLPPYMANQQIIVEDEVRTFLERKSFENVHFFPLH